MGRPAGRSGATTAPSVTEPGRIAFVKAMLLPLALAAVLVLVVGTAAASADANATKTAPRLVLAGNGLGVTSFGATSAAATKAITAELGKPTGHPKAGCTAAYAETAWHDLLVQFVSGRFEGYRYLIASYFSKGELPPTAALRSATPKLSTAAGITLGDTLTQAKRTYPSLRQSGTDFWRTTSLNVVGIAFGIYNPSGHTAPNAQIYEIKNSACPGSL